jgi:L,D-transpeptidase catalytic domain
MATRKFSRSPIPLAMRPETSMGASMKQFVFLLLSTVALVLTGCQTPRLGGATSFSYDPVVQAPQNPSNVQLKLSTGAQRLYVVEGDKVLLATPVSVGKPATPTPHGNFRIYSKVANRRRVSNPGAGYPMTYWMEFKSAYGLHWGFVKPVPATHGCVRMPIKAAQKTFNLVRNGTPINISSSQPWDATVGKSLPRLDDSHLPDPPMSYLLSPQVFADARQGKMWRF